MNRFLIAAAATLALTGAAAAMTNATASLQSEVDGYVSGIDLSQLTDAQVDAIKLTVHSGDSPSEVRAFIRSVVGG